VVSENILNFLGTGPTEKAEQKSYILVAAVGYNILQKWIDTL